MKFYNEDINRIAINALIDCGEIAFTNIGALRCKLLPSTIKEGSITPPRQVVEFHCAARAEANSLTQLIAWSYSISLEEAETAYNSWLTNIRTETSNGIIYTIDGLGTICTSMNNSTIFTTDREFTLQLNPLTQEFSQEPTAAQEVSYEPNKEIIMNDEKQPTTESNESFWKNLSALFIVLFVLALVAALFIYTKKPKEVIREIKIEKVITDTIYIGESTAIAEEAGVKTETATPLSTTTGSISNGKFHIIAGVFKSQANAEKAIKEFTKDGVTPIVEFIKERNEYFVSIGSFNTRQEAQKHLNTLGLANEKNYESHWIYQF